MGELQGVFATSDGTRFWFDYFGQDHYILHVETSPDHEHQIHLSTTEARDLGRLLHTKTER